ncbi:uncharacterized protein BCR38DRAFT_477869 [Pseudomassariella vexata]|uniref:Uncharacterized protein n=1 Tax=Pseudomassariella vexata TaxID=1141098 RepID=A0A1Y2DH58_9PEZI|nr:uncharacterized protein BCR38DRAFT_477869 [Pseudomassariella vexata]ORY58567.1 hypothetical protein BCR38DRAFT_477869 [Pseudomassariella vexata]
MSHGDSNHHVRRQRRAAGQQRRVHNGHYSSTHAGTSDANEARRRHHAPQTSQLGIAGDRQSANATAMAVDPACLPQTFSSLHISTSSMQGQQASYPGITTQYQYTAANQNFEQPSVVAAHAYNRVSTDAEEYAANGDSLASVNYNWQETEYPRYDEQNQGYGDQVHHPISVWANTPRENEAWTPEGVWQVPQVMVQAATRRQVNDGGDAWSDTSTNGDITPNGHCI